MSNNKISVNGLKDRLNQREKQREVCSEKDKDWLDQEIEKVKSKVDDLRNERLEEIIKLIQD